MMPESSKEELIDYIFDFVDDLLERHGEFYPVGAVIKSDGEIANVGVFEGDERPPSDDVITQLKEFLREGYLKGDFKAGVIFYDAYAVHPETQIKSDTVVVHYESEEEGSGCRYFYPYKLDEDKKLYYSRGWYNDITKEIFVR